MIRYALVVPWFVVVYYVLFSILMALPPGRSPFEIDNSAFWLDSAFFVIVISLFGWISTIVFVDAARIHRFSILLSLILFMITILTSPIRYPPQCVSTLPIINELTLCKNRLSIDAAWILKFEPITIIKALVGTP